MTTEKTEQIPAAETSTKEETKTEKTNDKFLQQEPTAENEIHVAAKGHIKNYLGYAFRILNKTNHQQLKIRATGNAIVKANILIELVKRRVGDLHQLNSIYSMVISSHEEKLGEKIETKRRVTAMDTLLSKSPLDTNDPGYQEPTPKDEPYQSQSRPSGQSRMNKKDDKRRRGPKLYNNPPMGGEDDDGKTDKKRGPDNKDRQQADQNKDKRSKRTRRDKINAPGVKDDEQSRRTDNRNMDRSRGGYMPQSDHYGRPMMGDGRNMQYNTPMGDRGFDPRRNQPRHMPQYMMYPGPRSFDDFGVRPMRGQKGNRRGYDQNNNYNRRPMNDMYMYGPPSYDQNYHYGGYDNYYGPPPDRRYPPRNHGHGPNENIRYNEPRGPRQPYNSERFNNDNQNPNYRGERSDRPMGQGPQMNEKQGRMMGPTNPEASGKQYEGRRYNEHRENRDGPKEDRDNRENREERPRYNQPRDDEPRGYRGGFDRGGGTGYGGSGFRRGGPRGGMGMGGPHRGGFDNDNEGGRSRFNGGFDNRNDGGSMRGIRGNLRGGRGHFERGRGGMERSHYNDDNSGPMHKISERRAEDGMENRRGMPPYRGGRGRDDEPRGGRSHYNDDERRTERGGFNASERGEEGNKDHKIISRSRGGLGSSGND